MSQNSYKRVFLLFLYRLNASQRQIRLFEYTQIRLCFEITPNLSNVIILIQQLIKAVFICINIKLFFFQLGVKYLYVHNNFECYSNTSLKFIPFWTDNIVKHVDLHERKIHISHIAVNIFFFYFDTLNGFKYKITLTYRIKKYQQINKFHFAQERA